MTKAGGVVLMLIGGLISCALAARGLPRDIALVAFLGVLCSIAGLCGFLAALKAEATAELRALLREVQSHLIRLETRPPRQDAANGAKEGS